MRPPGTNRLILYTLTFCTVAVAVAAVPVAVGVGQALAEPARGEAGAHEVGEPHHGEQAEDPRLPGRGERRQEAEEEEEEEEEAEEAVEGEAARAEEAVEEEEAVKGEVEGEVWGRTIDLFLHTGRRRASSFMSAEPPRGAATRTPDLQFFNLIVNKI